MQKKALFNKKSPKKTNHEMNKTTQTLKAQAASVKTMRLAVNHNQSLMRPER